VPAWEVPEPLKAFFDAESVTLKGTEFRVGFVRGSILGGDWGVSFVQKRIGDDFEVSRPRASECATCGVSFGLPDASIRGVEFHRFASFGTIKERVQIGMNFAGGIGSLKGTVQVTSVSRTGTIVQRVEAAELFAPWGQELSIVPLAKVELAVAAIVGPDVKVRVSGGFDFPGYDRVNIAVVYFFGAR
jgi:hypothetical protein